MLYYWLTEWSGQISALNVFRYITFRTFISFFTAFFVCWAWGPAFIRRMIKKQISQNVRGDGPATHLKKQGTPTMGGTLILFSLLVPSVLWVNLAQPLVLGVLFITFGFGAVGYWDDFLKVAKKNSKGLPGKLRLFLEFAISAGAIGALVYLDEISTQLYLPFFKNLQFDLGLFFVPFASLVIVGCANAVNLTDGLDGLAIVPVVVVAATFMIFTYVSGHVKIASYLTIPFVAGAGELTPLAGAVVAAGLGFLWYNSYPAQVFMGDVGSLGLGGFLGSLAVVTQNEILLILLGGIFVVEALSVISQVASFKLTGKRIFRMAPIHHHFELQGLSETKIIVRFWIISILLAVLSLSTLKLR